MRHTLLCCIKLIKAQIKGQMTHNWSFVVYVFSIMVVYASTLAGIWVILKRFTIINDWTYGQIAFIYILSLLSYGVRSLFFTPFRFLGILVKSGDMDNFLIRPINPFIYIMSCKFQPYSLSHILLGVILFWLLKDQFGITWNLTNIIYFILAVLSGALVQSAITIVIGSLAFFITETEGLDWIYNGFKEFIWYPVSLYNNVVKFILFFVIPLAFASYVPAGIFLDHPEYLIFPKWVWKISLLVGVVLILGAYGFWNIGLRHYQSTGS
ncbi:hypothetical protein BBF96_13875 [Anoxybacter fermentans]|uniref:ABC transporter permease n=1 Tax=Anoxybacter fermentans TaxID=1323375 RepID=A0A3Q9HRY4_9FIRM|nr:ABC-2 family transporter protein [Anoxybacter fermentans]AZR74379.1 hypothetical protein BBF96_13875 [Anoxybacter fermentans]